MPEGTIQVECPCCQSTLKVDASTGAVLIHKQPEKPKPIEDMRVAVAALKTAAAHREEVFQKSLADQKNRHSVLDKKFDELLKQASEDPNERPFRPDFDLD